MVGKPHIKGETSRHRDRELNGSVFQNTDLAIRIQFLDTGENNRRRRLRRECCRKHISTEQLTYHRIRTDSQPAVVFADKRNCVHGGDSFSRISHPQDSTAKSRLSNDTLIGQIRWKEFHYSEKFHSEARIVYVRRVNQATKPSRARQADLHRPRTHTRDIQMESPRSTKPPGTRSPRHAHVQTHTTHTHA